MKFSLQHFRPNGAKMALLPMLFFAFGIVVQIPRDWEYGLAPSLASVLTGLRVVVLILSGLAYFAPDSAWGRRHYVTLIGTLLSVQVLVGFSALVTRPVTELFDFLLAMTGVAYIYFLLPAPFVLKMIAGIGLSLLCLWSVFFLKAYTALQTWQVTLSFTLLNIMGPISAWSTQRLRARDFLNRERKDREAAFKAALADAGLDAVVIPDAGEILDFNQAFLDLVDLSPAEVRGKQLNEFLVEEEGEEPRVGILRSNGVEMPVEIRGREVNISGVRLNGYLIRDKSSEEIKGLRTYVDDLASRIQSLALSKREKEIVERIVEGHTRFQIAEALFISDETVKKHTGNIYRKLNLTSKTELIRLLMARD